MLNPSVNIDHQAFEQVHKFRAVSFNIDQYLSLIDEMGLPEDQWHRLDVSVKPHIHMINGLWPSMFKMAMGLYDPVSSMRIGRAEPNGAGGIDIKVLWHGLHNPNKTLIHETWHGVEMLTDEEGPEGCYSRYLQQRSQKSIFTYGRMPQEKRARAAERKYKGLYGNIIQIETT